MTFISKPILIALVCAGVAQSAFAMGKRMPEEWKVENSPVFNSQNATAGEAKAMVLKQCETALAKLPYDSLTRAFDIATGSKRPNEARFQCGVSDTEYEYNRTQYQLGCDVECIQVSDIEKCQAKFVWQNPRVLDTYWNAPGTGCL